MHNKREKVNYQTDEHPEGSFWTRTTMKERNQTGKRKELAIKWKEKRIFFTQSFTKRKSRKSHHDHKFWISVLYATHILYIFHKCGYTDYVMLWRYVFCSHFLHQKEHYFNHPSFSTNQTSRKSRTIFCNITTNWNIRNKYWFANECESRMVIDESSEVTLRCLCPASFVVCFVFVLKFEFETLPFFQSSKSYLLCSFKRWKLN